MLTREDDVDAHKLHAKGRPVAVIEHPPGEETQFDWVELPDPPAARGWGATAHLLVGALSHSSKWRGRLAESEDQPHVIDGLDRLLHRSVVINLDGDSYRLRDHHARNDTLRPTATSVEPDFSCTHRRAMDQREQAGVSGCRASV